MFAACAHRGPTSVVPALCWHIRGLGCGAPPQHILWPHHLDDVCSKFLSTQFTVRTSSRDWFIAILLAHIEQVHYKPIKHHGGNMYLPSSPHWNMRCYWILLDAPTYTQKLDIYMSMIFSLWAFLWAFWFSFPCFYRKRVLEPALHPCCCIFQIIQLLFQLWLIKTNRILCDSKTYRNQIRGVNSQKKDR